MDLREFRNLTGSPQEPVRVRARIAQRSKFSPDEDIRLKDLVELYGCHAWPAISKIFGGDRTARQCRDRWNNYLAPDLCHEPWTPQEDQLLLQKYTEIGNHWGQIQQFLEKRSVNSVRNRYIKLSGSSSRTMPYGLPPTSVIHNNTPIRIPPPPPPMHIIPATRPMQSTQIPEHIVPRPERKKRARRAHPQPPQQDQQEDQVPEGNVPAKALEMFENIKEELESWVHNPQIFNHDE